ncbi:hypothetical protein IWZ01DRAFT_541112 [Phyllosticta capitalensis]
MSIGSKSNSTPEQVDLEPNRNMQRNRDAWLVVHTGALHVCNRREAFIAFQEIKAFTVSTNSDNPSLGLNHTYTARGIGQTRINFTSVDGTSHERVLQDVLHVPEAFANFVSLPRLFCPAEEQYKLDRKLGVAYSMDGRELAWFPPDNQGLLCLVLDNSLSPLFEGPSALHRNAPTTSFEVHMNGFPRLDVINSAPKLDMVLRHLKSLDDSDKDEIVRWGTDRVDMTVSEIIKVVNEQLADAESS